MKTDLQISHSESIGLIDVNAKEASISNANLASALSIVSEKLYTNPIAAFIREITSNCIDAHKDLGITKNVEVMIEQTEDDAFVTFRDFGKGMSHEFMETVYLSYFDSTKKDSDEMIGGFGIGSKSPFAYTDSFYIETQSIQTTEKRIYLFFKNEKGIPSLLLQEVEESEFENHGTKIKVPLHDKQQISLIKENAPYALLLFPGITSNFFKSPLIDPKNYVNTKNYILFTNRDLEEVSQATNKSSKVSYRYGQKEQTENIYLSLGDVLYSLPISKFPVHQRQILFLISKIEGLILKFEISELKPNPNRENIMLDDFNITSIVQKSETVMLELVWALTHHLSKTTLEVNDNLGICTFKSGEDLRFIVKSIYYDDWIPVQVGNDSKLIIPNEILKYIGKYVDTNSNDQSELKLLFDRYEESIQTSNESLLSWELIKKIVTLEKNKFFYRDFVDSNPSIDSSLDKSYELFMICTNFLGLDIEHAPLDRENFSIQEINKVLCQKLGFFSDTMNINYCKHGLNSDLKEVSKSGYLRNNYVLFHDEFSKSKASTSCVKFYNSGAENRASQTQYLISKKSNSGILSSIDESYYYNQEDYKDFLKNFFSSYEYIKVLKLSKFVEAPIVNSISRFAENTFYECIRSSFSNGSQKLTKQDFIKLFVDITNKRSYGAFTKVNKERFLEYITLYLESIPDNIYRFENLLLKVLEGYSINNETKIKFKSKLVYSKDAFSQLISVIKKEAPVLTGSSEVVKKKLETYLNINILTTESFNNAKEKYFVKKYSFKNVSSYIEEALVYYSSISLKNYVYQLANRYEIIENPKTTLKNFEKETEEFENYTKDFLKALKESKLDLQSLEKPEQKENVVKVKVEVDQTKLTVLYLTNPTIRSVSLSFNRSISDILLCDFLENLDTEKEVEEPYRDVNKLFMFCKKTEVERIKSFVSTAQWVYSSYRLSNLKNNFDLPRSNYETINSDFIYVFDDEQLDYLKNKIEISEYLIHFDEFILTVHPFFVMSLFLQITNEEMILEFGKDSEFITCPTKKIGNSYHCMYPSINNNISGSIRNKFHDPEPAKKEPFSKSGNKTLKTNRKSEEVEEYYEFKKRLDTVGIIIDNSYSLTRREKNSDLFFNNEVIKELLSYIDIRINYFYFRCPDSNINSKYSNSVSFIPCFSEKPIYEGVLKNDIQKELVQKFYQDCYNGSDSIEEGISATLRKSFGLSGYLTDMVKLYDMVRAQGFRKLSIDNFELKKEDLEIFLNLETELNYEAYCYLFKLGNQIYKTYQEVKKDIDSFSKMLFSPVSEYSFSNMIPHLLNFKSTSFRRIVILSESYFNQFNKKTREFVIRNAGKLSYSYTRSSISDKDGGFIFQIPDLNSSHYSFRKTTDERFKHIGNPSEKVKLINFLNSLNLSLKSSSFVTRVKIKGIFQKWNEFGFPLKEERARIFNQFPIKDYNRGNLSLSKSQLDSSLTIEDEFNLSWKTNPLAKLQVVDLFGLDIKQKRLKLLKVGDRNLYTKDFVSDKDIFYNISEDRTELLKLRDLVLTKNKNKIGIEKITSITPLNALKHGKV
ncbi:MAG: hypothetical protein EBU90_01720 [Proteobacteria bacterium]|nr:hypothetical protein [Pseudomonadota bacterium]